MKYNWQQEDWTKFTFDLGQLAPKQLVFAEKMGFLNGVLDGLPKNSYQHILIEVLLQEALKSSEIEGEFFSRAEVFSSISNNLGIPSTHVTRDLRVKGIADLATEVFTGHAVELSDLKLFGWHKMLFPLKSPIHAGQWREDNAPMQIVSGAAGKELIHFEAPPSVRVEQEMHQYFLWLANSKQDKKSFSAPIRSAIAHLYFESIHPFEDGNGRIGRAIAEKVLFESLNMPLLLSISSVIEKNRKAYYSALKTAQRTNEITAWIHYWLDVLIAAQDEAIANVQFVIQKTALFQKIDEHLNDRQKRIVVKMLEVKESFKGGMSAKKYMKIAKTSKPTATRDIQKLVEMGVFQSYGAGRSTSYQIKLES